MCDALWRSTASEADDRITVQHRSPQTDARAVTAGNADVVGIVVAEIGGGADLDGAPGRARDAADENEAGKESSHFSGS